MSQSLLLYGCYVKLEDLNAETFQLAAIIKKKEY